MSGVAAGRAALVATGTPAASTASIVTASGYDEATQRAAPNRFAATATWMCRGAFYCYHPYSGIGLAGEGSSAAGLGGVESGLRAGQFPLQALATEHFVRGEGEVAKGFQFRHPPTSPASASQQARGCARRLRGFR